MEFVRIENYGYEISRSGVVRNIATKKVLKVRPGGTSAYLIVSIRVDGRQKNFLLHRLLAKAFIPNPQNKPQVNHIDSNKLNNSLDNLEWVTQSENLQHSWNSGLRKYKPLHYKGKSGSLHNRSKSVRVKETGQIFGSQCEAARALNISNTSVCWSIKYGKPINGMHFETAI